MPDSKHHSCRGCYKQGKNISTCNWLVMIKMLFFLLLNNLNDINLVMSENVWWSPLSFGQYIFKIQIVGFLIGSYCAPLVADMFWFVIRETSSFL